MTPKKFDTLAKRYFGELLVPKGFSCSGSEAATFYRHVSPEVVHFVLVDLGSGGSWYDVKVFASSPKIEPEFEEKFPDSVGVPSGALCYLHPSSGVGPDQKRYSCKTEEDFVRVFDSEVAPAVETKAIPYLDQISSIQSLLPFIRHDFYLGVALWHAGDKEQAEKVLAKEVQRLTGIQDPTGRVAALLKHIESLRRSEAS
jgi:hypothetical protein